VITDDKVPGWHVWYSNKGTPHAVLRGPVLSRDELAAGLSMTLVGADDDDLLAQIGQQAKIRLNSLSLA
jgi:hypothetical protein